MKKVLLFLSIICSAAMAQLSSGVLQGTITEKANGEELPFVNVILQKEGVFVQGVTSDFDGKYKFKNVEVGSYSIEARMVGYESVKITDVEIKENKTTTLNIAMGSGAVELDCVEIVTHNAPLIEKSSTAIAIRSNRIGKISNRRDERKTMKWENSNHEAPQDGIYIQQEEGRNTYGTFKENAFIDVNSEALSTFSIDVDHASYSIVRRHINQGSIPPADAVRIEEMINYFSYNYKASSSEHPLSVDYELGNSPWSKNKIVKIALKGEDLNPDYVEKNNLVFLLDVSGSMASADKLEYVKKSMKMLVNQLGKEDKVAIVTYAGRSATVLKPTSCAKNEEIYSAIDRLSSGGSTNGEGGIKRAYQLAEEHYIKNGNNRVILCTDGDFNVGVSSNMGLERLIESKRKSGVFLTVCGFGFGNLQDGYMEILADKGNGNYYYIDNLMEAKKVFQDEFTSTIYTIAKDVKLQIEFNPTHVASYRLIGYDNRMLAKEDFLDDTKDAGELGANHRVTALYEIVLRDDGYPYEPQLKYQSSSLNENYNGELMTIKLRYKEPKASKSKGFEVPVLNNEMMVESADFQFALAVAEFGLVLKDSKFKEDANVQDAIRLAKAGKGEDEYGYRAEFIRLMEMYNTMFAQN